VTNSLHVFYNDEGVRDDSPEFIKDTEHAFVAGKTHWWKVAKQSLHQCDDIYVHRPGRIVFKATIEHERCRRREDGRIEIAFSAPQRVDAAFDWNNQNPVRYNALTRKPLELAHRHRSSKSRASAFRLTEQTIREAIKETGLARLRKLADMVELIASVAQAKPKSADELGLLAARVCEEYQNRN
jgi:hypothetical protein